MLKLKRKRKVAIFVDYENVAKSVVDQGKNIDLDAVTRQCAEIGCIEFAYLFAPMHLVSYSLPAHVCDKGFYVVACPGRNGKDGKEKDRVDTIMTEMGFKLINSTNLTDIVIVSADGDFVRLANHARFHLKRVTVFAGDNLSYLLKRAVDVVLPVPTKPK